MLRLVAKEILRKCCSNQHSDHREFYSEAMWRERIRAHCEVDDRTNPKERPGESPLDIVGLERSCQTANELKTQRGAVECLQKSSAALCRNDRSCVATLSNFQICKMIFKKRGGLNQGRSA